jgi:hypothetical protein
MAIRVTGDVSAAWTLRAGSGGWEVEDGFPSEPTVTATMTDQLAWRLLFNALPPATAQSMVRLDGEAALALPLLRARSVIV